jgi:hypothetical protein
VWSRHCDEYAAQRARGFQTDGNLLWRVRLDPTDPAHPWAVVTYPYYLQMEAGPVTESKLPVGPYRDLLAKLNAGGALTTQDLAHTTSGHVPTTQGQLTALVQLGLVTVESRGPVDVWRITDAGRERVLAGQTGGDE